MPEPEETATESRVAVLASGGLESAILCVDLRKIHHRVYPLYIRCGLRWEEAELAALGGFLAAVRSRFDGIEPLTVLDEPIGDVYGRHWSTGAMAVPGAETPDEAVYLPGRNLVLTVKAAVWCRLREVRSLALGSLGSNPFPDSTPEFYRDLEGVLNRAMAGSIRLMRPFDRLYKADVLSLGRDLPLHLTFSCIDPSRGLHCGACNKCAERRKGFRGAGLIDRTRYANTTDEGPARPAGERPALDMMG